MALTDESPTTPPAPAAPARSRRRWLTVLLAVVLVATLATGAYLAVLARAWSARADVLDTTATDLGRRLAQTEADLDQRSSDLGAVQAQLQTAQDRLVQLADEKAQTGDDREAQRQLAAYQARVSEAARAVASALQECVRGQERLIGYLKDQERYDPASLAGFEGDVTRLCDQAEAANTQLQRELGQ
ncbi:hypothetical protein GB882_16575 [Georgenia ruanii]|uniref:Uncharacterized protein n=1 Tax=Georgenia ruanii TaxID=348442 RepID=A0A7J9V2E9_9MICO|nr:hypothetical protein [Georgenia ruanii]